jgi:putative transposase
MNFPVIILCRVMQVSTSAYYAWRKRPGKLIDADVLHLHRRIKSLFKQSRNSLVSRELMNNLRKEGITICRYKVRKLMKKLDLSGDCYGFILEKNRGLVHQQAHDNRLD